MFGQGKPDKEAWLKEAEEAYEKVFGPRDKAPEGGRPLTFSEIEEEAVREGNKLAVYLSALRTTGEVQAGGAGHQGASSTARCGFF